MANITWIDVETTGLNAHEHRLLEVACLVTDENLNILDQRGYQAVVFHDATGVAEAKNTANDFAYRMHEKTGLWERLLAGKMLSQIDVELRQYVAQFSKARTSPVGGNSVRRGMNFMDAYLPLTAGHLDYHMRDVFTIAGLASDWFDAPWFEKASDHTAMTDIQESIRELKHYRELIFKKVAN